MSASCFGMCIFNKLNSAVELNFSWLEMIFRMENIPRSKKLKMSEKLVVDLYFYGKIFSPCHN